MASGVATYSGMIWTALLFAVVSTGFLLGCLWAVQRMWKIWSEVRRGLIR